MKVLMTAHSSESAICAVICMLLQRSLLQTLNIHVWWKTYSALTSFPAANKSLMYGGKVFTRRPPGKYLRFLCQQNISKLLFYIYSLNSSLSRQTHNYFHISTWCVSWARRFCLFNLHHSARRVGGGGYLRSRSGVYHTDKSELICSFSIGPKLQLQYWQTQISLLSSLEPMWFMDGLISCSSSTVQ